MKLNMLKSFVCLAIFLQLAESVIHGYNNLNETTTFKNFDSEFGNEIGENGLVGFLVSANPPEACTPIDLKPDIPNNQTRNITGNVFVLIKRGTCDFAIKVLNAQNANYDAVIVANVNSDDLLHMGTFRPDIERSIHIPSVFVGETSGNILNRTYLYFKANEPFVKITRGEASISLEMYLIPLAAVTGCFVLLIAAFGTVRMVREYRVRHRNRLSRQRLLKLPKKNYAKEDKYDTCAICLEDYEEGESLRILPCDHAYHCKCVDPWLTSNKRVCPLCKRKVLSDDEASDSDDYDDASDTNEEAPLLGGRSSTTSSSSNRLQPEYPNNHSQYGSGMTTAYNNHICSFAPTAAAPLVPETACGYQQDDGSTDSGPALLLSRSAPAPSVATGNFQYEDETTPIAFDSSNSAMDANDSTIENIEATMDCTDDEAFYGEDLPLESTPVAESNISNAANLLSDTSSLTYTSCVSDDTQPCRSEDSFVSGYDEQPKDFPSDAPSSARE